MNLVTAILLAVLGILPLAAPPAGAAYERLPISVPDSDWRPLDQRWDRGLQARLDQALRQNPLWQSLVLEGKMAVGLVDLNDPKAPRYARVNGNTMMYAASLPKIAVLLAAYQSMEDGSLRQTPKLEAELVEMIRRSDNAATNRVIDQVGLRKIGAVVTDPRYRFYDQGQGGGLWVGTNYGLHLEQNLEPLKNLDHAATVNQVCRFYYLLAYGRLINPQRSKQILVKLAFPDLDDKFMKSLGKSVRLEQMYRKSGEWRTWYSDSILVWAPPKRRYILAALIDHSQGEKILQELLPVAEGLLRPGLPVRPGPAR